MIGPAANTEYDAVLITSVMKYKKTRSTLPDEYNKHTSCPIDYMTMGLPNVSEALYAIIPATSDDRRVSTCRRNSIRTSGRNSHPCYGPYRGLVDGNEVSGKEVYEEGSA